MSDKAKDRADAAREGRTEYERAPRVRAVRRRDGQFVDRDALMRAAKNAQNAVSSWTMSAVETGAVVDALVRELFNATDVETWQS